MLMQQGRAIEAAGPEAKTFTGNRGLEIEEGLDLRNRAAGEYRRRSRRALAIQTPARLARTARTGSAFRA